MGADQLYLVIGMADCGSDLERHRVAGWDEARALMAQVRPAGGHGEGRAVQEWDA